MKQGELSLILIQFGNKLKLIVYYSYMKKINRHLGNTRKMDNLNILRLGIYIFFHKCFESNKHLHMFFILKTISIANMDVCNSHTLTGNVTFLGKSRIIHSVFYNNYKIHKM